MYKLWKREWFPGKAVGVRSPRQPLQLICAYPKPGENHGSSSCVWTIKVNRALEFVVFCTWKLFQIIYLTDWCSEVLFRWREIGFFFCCCGCQVGNVVCSAHRAAVDGMDVCSQTDLMKEWPGMEIKPWSAGASSPKMSVHGVERKKRKFQRNAVIGEKGCDLPWAVQGPPVICEGQRSFLVLMWTHGTINASPHATELFCPPPLCLVAAALSILLDCHRRIRSSFFLDAIYLQIQ